MFAWYGLCLLHGMVYACCMVWSMPAAWYGLCLLHGMVYACCMVCTPSFLMKRRQGDRLMKHRPAAGKSRTHEFNAVKQIPPVKRVGGSSGYIYIYIYISISWVRGRCGNDGFRPSGLVLRLLRVARVCPRKIVRTPMCRGVRVSSWKILPCM